MTARLNQEFLSAKEYLNLERSSMEKNEYINGSIVAMTRTNRSHSLIGANVSSMLTSQLRKRPCEVYYSYMRIKACETGLYTYPDIVVVCGKPQLEDEKKGHVAQPNRPH